MYCRNHIVLIKIIYFYHISEWCFPLCLYALHRARIVICHNIAILSVDGTKWQNCSVFMIFCTGVITQMWAVAPVPRSNCYWGSEPSSLSWRVVWTWRAREDCTKLRTHEQSKLVKEIFQTKIRIENCPNVEHPNAFHSDYTN